MVRPLFLDLTGLSWSATAVPLVFGRLLLCQTGDDLLCLPQVLPDQPGCEPPSLAHEGVCDLTVVASYDSR